MRAIYEHARACLETPFVHQGRVLGVGMDCAGVVAHAVSAAGLPVNDVFGYTRAPMGGLLKQTLDSHSFVRRIPVSETPVAGDILLMHFGNEPQHLAIAGETTIVHAYQNVG